MSDINIEVKDSNGVSLLCTTQTELVTITTGIAESDPIFMASPAALISNNDIANWDDAYEWGDHATEGYLKTITETDPVWTAEKANYYSKTQADGRYLQSFTESDPVWNAEKANYYNKTQADGRYLQSFTESDPVWNAEKANYYNKTQADGRYLQSFTESDPVFAANGVTLGTAQTITGAKSFAGTTLINTTSTNSTAAPLQVEGNISVNNAIRSAANNIVLWPTVDNSRFIFNASTSSLRFNSAGGNNVFKVGNSEASGPLALEAGNAEKVRINSNGNVLVGTTTDNGNKLQVQGTISSSALAGGGLKLIAADTNGKLTPSVFYITKLNTTSRSNITVPADDPDLQFTVPVGSAYTFRATVYFFGDPTTDFRYRYNVTNVTNGGVLVKSENSPPVLNPGTASFVARCVEVQFTGTEVNVTWTSATLPGFVNMTGFVDATTAVSDMTFAFQWAAINPGATNTTVLRGSFMEIIKVV